VGVFFSGCGKFSAFFLIVFFYPPCYETPKNAIKKIEQNNRQPRDGGKKTEEKKTTFCVMSPDGFFWKKVLSLGKMLRIGLGANSPVLVPSTMY
jgi:hypothetical protein